MKQQLFRTTCKRCGKSITSSFRARQHPLGAICDGCITEEERLEILASQAQRILGKVRRIV